MHLAPLRRDVPKRNMKTRRRKGGHGVCHPFLVPKHVVQHWVPRYHPPRTIPECQILHEHPWYRYKYTWRAPFFVQPGSQAETRHNQRVWHSSGHDLYPCPERMAPSPNRIALGGHCLCNISAARARLQQCPAAPVENGLRTLGLGP